MIDYPEDAALVDHKGRTKPIYKPQTPRPQAWRPSHGMRLLMGLVPGVRLLALQSLALGLVYVVPGLVTLLLGIFMMLYWSASSERLALLQGEPRWLLVQAAGILGAALVYELLRAAAALEERVKAPKGPRILGALVIPGWVAVLGAPSLVSLAPPLVEATFFAGLILAMGGAPGALWCTLENGVRPEVQHQRFKVGMIILGLIYLILAGLLLGGGALFPRWIKVAQDHGFHLLPNLLQ